MPPCATNTRADDEFDVVIDADAVLTWEPIPTFWDVFKYWVKMPFPTAFKKAEELVWEIHMVVYNLKEDIYERLKNEKLPWAFTQDQMGQELAELIKNQTRGAR